MFRNDTFSLSFSLSSFLKKKEILHHLITSASFHSLLRPPLITSSSFTSLHFSSCFVFRKRHLSCCCVCSSLHLLIPLSSSPYQLACSRTACFLSPLPSSIFPLPPLIPLLSLHLSFTLTRSEILFLSPSSPLHSSLLSSFNSLHPFIHTFSNLPHGTSLTKSHLHNQPLARLKTSCSSGLRYPFFIRYPSITSLGG